MVNFSVMLLKILFIMYFCNASKDARRTNARRSDASKTSDIIPDLYNTHLEVVNKDENMVTRRLFRDSNQYLRHIEKLKDVNGIKTHNLIVTNDDNKTDDSIIYINNPVESHIPFAYLTKEQFKKDVLENTKKRREEFEFQIFKKKLEHFKNDVKRTTKIYTTTKRITSHKNTIKKRKIHKKIITTTIKEAIITEKSTENVETTSIEETSTYVEDEGTTLYDIGTDKSTTSETPEDTSTTYTDESTTPEPTEDISTTSTDESTTPEQTEDISTTSTESTIFYEETEPATETSTKSTPRTRGRPFVFMGEGFKNG